LLIVNIFTLARFVLAVAIVFAAMSDRWNLVFIYAVLAFSTDWVDGAAARGLGVVSPFGKFVDPLADKAVCLAVLWPAAYHYGSWPYWLCAILITCYDVCTMSMRVFVRRTRGTVVAASTIAKLKTAMLMFGLLFTALGIALERQNPVLHDLLRYAGLALLLAATAMAARSLWHYSKIALPAISFVRWPGPRHVVLTTSVTNIDFADWHRRNIDCLLLDIEGTILPWKTQAVPAEIVEALKKARQAGIREIGVISNISRKDEARVRAICKQINVEHYWIPQTRRARKPNTAMLKHAMQHFHAKPSEVAYVGDKFVDVIAGKRAHVAAIVWVRRLGKADHPLDYWLYRPLEPLIRQFVSWLKV